MMKVSVVIPAYNCMAFLPATLDSVLKQTFSNFEVLIVDDGSPDQVGAWVAQVADARVRLISQANQGVAEARNTGIAESEGEYIAFLDNDDLWHPTKLEKQVHYFEANPTVGVVYTWTVLVDEQEQPTGRIFASQAEGNVWQALLESDVISNGSSAMVRRCCFETVGGFDRNLNFAADLDMWLRLTTHYPFGLIKEPLTLYRQHSNSMSKDRQQMIQHLRMAIEKAFQSVPLEMLYLRNRAYASINLGLAWLAVDEGDPVKASHFRHQAFLHHALVRYSERYIRLSMAIALTRLFGAQGYDGVRSLTRIVKRRIMGVLI